LYGCTGVSIVFVASTPSDSTGALTPSLGITNRAIPPFEPAWAGAGTAVGAAVGVLVGVGVGLGVFVAVGVFVGVRVAVAVDVWVAWAAAGWRMVFERGAGLPEHATEHKTPATPSTIPTAKATRPRTTPHPCISRD
jgi:hypothetical protein